MEIIRDGIAIKLTNEELEQAHRECQHNYLLQDAFKHLIDYINIYEINVIGEYGCTFEDMTNLQSEQYLLDKIVEQFEKLSDCNIDENDTWIDACRVVLTIKKLRMQKLKEEIK